MRAAALTLAIGILCALLAACGESADNAPTPVPIPSTVSPTAIPAVGDQQGIDIEDVQVVCRGETAHVSLHALTDVRLPERAALFVLPGRGQQAYTPVTEPLKVEVSMTGMGTGRFGKRETLVEGDLPEEIGEASEEQFQLFLASLVPGRLLRSQTVLLDTVKAACP